MSLRTAVTLFAATVNQLAPHSRRRLKKLLPFLVVRFFLLIAFLALRFAARFVVGFFFRRTHLGIGRSGSYRWRRCGRDGLHQDRTFCRRGVLGFRRGDDDWLCGWRVLDARTPTWCGRVFDPIVAPDLSWSGSGRLLRLLFGNGDSRRGNRL